MIPKTETLAIERFILNVSIPIIYEDIKKDVPLGTGTLFTIKDRFFLITARHLFDEPVKPDRIACPATPIKAQVYTLGKSNIGLPDDKRFDVAVIELLEPETIDRLRIGWQFLSRNNIALPSEGGLFLLSGYPASLVTEKQGWLHGKMLTVYTNRTIGIPKEADLPVDKDLDLFFEFNTETETLDGVTKSTPKLQGTSGASIWEYVSVGKEEIWTPERSLRVVGVQSMYRHKKYFRAASWTMVVKALSKIDPGLVD